MSRKRRSNPKSNSSSSRSQNEKPRTNEGSERSAETNSSSQDSSEAKETGSSYSKNGMNDPEWYKRDLKLFEDVSRVNFSDPLGSPLNIDASVQFSWKDSGGTYHDYNFDSQNNAALPGILSLVTKPTFGANWDITDPLNVCANAFYTHVRYVNSGRKNYDPADLMMYALAISDLYSFVMYCQRIYGYAFMYSQRNQYIGRDLLLAGNINATDVASNLANFRAWLNIFINKVSSYAVPADIALFKRRAFMYASLYTESTTGNIKDQLYQFIPDGFYQFTLDSAGKGMLKYMRFRDIYSSPLTVSQLMNFGNTLLANITGDEDFGLMSGDIIKAYGANTIALGSIPDEYFVLPVYEEFVLSQIRNATIAKPLCGASSTTYQEDISSTESFKSGDVFQDTRGNLIYNDFAFEPRDQLSIIANKIMTVTNPEPTSDDVMEASRLMAVYDDTTMKNYYLPDVSTSNVRIWHTPIVSGSDVVVEALMYTHEWVNNVWTGVNYLIDSNAIGDSDQLTTAEKYLKLAQFHWAPQLFVFTAAVDAQGVVQITSWRPLSNYDNYTVLAAYTVKKLHDVALMSLVYVPGIAKMINFAGEAK